MTFVERRGLDAIVEKLRRFGHAHAVSGSVAATRKDLDEKWRLSPGAA